MLGHRRLVNNRSAILMYMQGCKEGVAVETLEHRFEKDCIEALVTDDLAYRINDKLYLSEAGKNS